MIRQRLWAGLVSAGLFFPVNLMAETANVGGRLFECVVKEGVDWHTGRFEVSEFTKLMLRESPELYFDEASGLLRFFSATLQFKILEDQAVQAETENDLIAIHDVQGTGSRMVNIVRISTWLEHMPFLYAVGSTGIFTGTCRVVG